MQFCRAPPTGELKNPHFSSKIINERIKLTTFLAISYTLLVRLQSNTSIVMTTEYKMLLEFQRR
jgi:hypothetical protein